MAGISFLISKCSCPMYETCAYSSTGTPTIKKVYIIPLKLSKVHFQSSSSLQATTHLLKNRLYSSLAGNSGYEVSDIGGSDGNDFFHKGKEAYTHDSSVTKNLEMAKEALVEVEKCFWPALMAPMRALFIFMATSQWLAILAPQTNASHYTASAWNGALILSFLWLLNGWKINVLVRKMRTLKDVDHEKLLTLDKISSAGLSFLGCMALCKASGVGVQYILTVRGIGGLLAAFVAGEILCDILSGLFVKVTQPFRIGDTIKVGSVQGKVIEMGLTTTSLLRAKKLPIKVPNSLFSYEVIVNKSRVGWRVMESKIPMRIDGFEKIPKILKEIINMMKSNSNVLLEKEQPYCIVSRVEGSFVVLTIGCNLKMMEKPESPSIVYLKVVREKGNCLLARITLISTGTKILTCK